MTQKIEIDLAEAEQVFRFLEKANHLFHQPTYYKDPQMVEAFAKGNYPEIHKLYYDLVWSWFPKEFQNSLMEEEPS